jgi:PQQ-dependent catabolism-associated CXXCW motif protein
VLARRIQPRIPAAGIGRREAAAGTWADYRLEDYRAPTPATLSGARVVTTAEAHQLWTDKAAVFIDVLPQAPRPANLPENVLWRDKPRFDIPGSMWLPDTGYGALAPEVERYFLDGLARAAGGDQERTPSCSTASAIAGCRGTPRSGRCKRDIPNVIWYPDGTEGWSEGNIPSRSGIQNRAA